MMKTSKMFSSHQNKTFHLKVTSMLRFFAKALEFHSSALVEDKKILTKAESIGAEIIEEQTKLSLLDRGIQFFGKIGKKDQ